MAQPQMVMAQPMAMAQPMVAMVPALPPANSGQWNFAAFSCFSNIDICCYTMFCGLCAAAEYNASITGGGCGGPFFFVCCCPMCWTCCTAPGLRTQLRQKYGLPTDPCDDCLFHVCCNGLAICQGLSEMRARGKYGGPCNAGTGIMLP